MNAKRKGTQGENELSEILRKSGIRAYRNDQIYVGGYCNPDIQAEICDIPLHIEVKRVEKLNVSAAMNQAIKDATDEALPILAHRKNREQWLVTLPLLRLLDTLKQKGILKNE